MKVQFGFVDFMDRYYFWSKIKEFFKADIFQVQYPAIEHLPSYIASIGFHNKPFKMFHKKQESLITTIRFSVFYVEISLPCKKNLCLENKVYSLPKGGAK